MFAISCAAINDVSAWCLLTVITAIVHSGAPSSGLLLRFAGLGVYLFVMIAVVRPILGRALPAAQSLENGRFLAVMILLLGSVCATEALSIDALFGAFLFGFVMPRSTALEEALRQRIEPVTLALFLPPFFAYTGLRTSVGLLDTPEDWLLCGIITLVAVASKFLVTALCLRAGGIDWRESFAVGALVNTRGLVELVS
jgi:Kef-type K+ transport system membrane component KefB